MVETMSICFTEATLSPVISALIKISNVPGFHLVLSPSLCGHLLFDLVALYDCDLFCHVPHSAAG